MFFFLPTYSLLILTPLWRGPHPLSGSLLITRPGTLAVDALPVQGSIAKVVRGLRELYVVDLQRSINDFNIHHWTNLIGLRSLLSLCKNVATAFFASSNQGWVTRQHFSRTKKTGNCKFWTTVLWREEKLVNLSPGYQMMKLIKKDFSTYRW